MKKLIYLACPFTHPDKSIEEERYHRVTRLTAKLFERGFHVFSPITHCYWMYINGLKGTWDFWKEYNKRFLDIADILVIYQLEGWDKSDGVAEECTYMVKMRKDVIYHSTEEGIINLLSESFFEISSLIPH